MQWLIESVNHHFRKTLHLLEAYNYDQLVYYDDNIGSLWVVLIKLTDVLY